MTRDQDNRAVESGESEDVENNGSLPTPGRHGSPARKTDYFFLSAFLFVAMVSGDKSPKSAIGALMKLQTGGILIIGNAFNRF